MRDWALCGECKHWMEYFTQILVIVLSVLDVVVKSDTFKQVFVLFGCDIKNNAVFELRTFSRVSLFLKISAHEKNLKSFDGIEIRAYLVVNCETCVKMF